MIKRLKKVLKQTMRLSEAEIRINQWALIDDPYKTLDLSYLELKYIPSLPHNVLRLNVSNNCITKLDNLPDELQELDCSHNQLYKITKLPSNLRKLTCIENELILLENLPNSLIYSALLHAIKRTTSSTI